MHDTTTKLPAMRRHTAQPTRSPVPLVKRECPSDDDVVKYEYMSDNEDEKGELDRELEPQAEVIVVSDDEAGTGAPKRAASRPIKRKKPRTETSSRTAVNPTPRKPRVGRGRKWTGAELEALLAAATGLVPTSKFADSVPGRAASQCYLTWRSVQRLGWGRGDRKDRS